MVCLKFHALNQIMLKNESSSQTIYNALVDSNRLSLFHQSGLFSLQVKLRADS
jgi:hypothetical protein